jgi:NDP-sugar pyrophosphorylase family protein
MSVNNLMMDAIILAGGRGTRLQSIVNDRPKPMADVAGRPFLEILIDILVAQGIRRIILCTGYKSHSIEDHFNDGSKWGIEILYSRESSPLGTAGAVRNALDLVRSDPFLALNGDSYCPWNAVELLHAHASRHSAATLWLVPNDDCGRFGSVLVHPDGRVLAFLEKESRRVSGLINAGIYCLDREVVRKIPAEKQLSMETDVFPFLVGHGLYAVIGNGPFVDIGTPESFEKAQSLLLSK